MGDRIVVFFFFLRDLHVIVSGRFQGGVICL